MVHVPSISSVTIGSTCFGYPIVTISYHATKATTRISYSSWEDCQADFKRIKAALLEVETLLEKILLTQEEEVKKSESKKVEKNMIELKESIDTMEVLVKELAPQQPQEGKGKSE